MVPLKRYCESHNVTFNVVSKEGRTVTTTVSVFGHPDGLLAKVVVTMYCCVIGPPEILVNVQTGSDKVLSLSPIAGVHKY